jgi:hypothetical protein
MHFNCVGVEVLSNDSDTKSQSTLSIRRIGNCERTAARVKPRQPGPQNQKQSQFFIDIAIARLVLLRSS